MIHSRIIDGVMITEDWIQEQMLKLRAGTKRELTPRQEAVINCRLGHGLGVARPMTLQEIAERYCVSRERIRQIEGNALKNLVRFSRWKETP
jgi:DNA-directed RNA polymerase sigma subunit (sigma70/sigma32)